MIFRSLAPTKTAFKTFVLFGYSEITLTCPKCGAFIRFEYTLVGPEYREDAICCFCGKVIQEKLGGDVGIVEGIPGGKVTAEAPTWGKYLPILAILGVLLLSLGKGK